VAFHSLNSDASPLQICDGGWGASTSNRDAAIEVGIDDVVELSQLRHCR